MLAQNLPQNTVTFIQVDQLITLIQSALRLEIRDKQEVELQDKLLSPRETCKLFNPKISLVTLESWTKKDLLIKHYIGGRTYYKYSQVMESLKTLKRYHVK